MLKEGLLNAARSLPYIVVRQQNAVPLIDCDKSDCVPGINKNAACDRILRGAIDRVISQLPYNRGMKQLDLFLPFALMPQEMSRDLLRELKMPSLAMLLARGKPLFRQSNDDFSRALPHENLIAQRFGLHTPSDNCSPQLAAGVIRMFDLPVESGFWFIVQPAHLHIARDHLVLTDPRQLNLSEQDSHALFDVVKPLFEESGRTLLYVDATTWLLRADDLQALQTSTPDAASGHNIDIWMPHGEQARDWRRLQNEVQMHWHTHPVNDAREMQGLKPVNSVWLWGGASVPAQTTQTQSPTLFATDDASSLFKALAAKTIAAASPQDILASQASNGLLILEALIGPAIAGDWAEWLARFQMLENVWFTPLLDAIKNGRLDTLSITLSHNTVITGHAIGKSSLHKFWRAPSLARLAA